MSLRGVHGGEWCGVVDDPPYDVEFTAYSKGGFGWKEQERTAEWLAPTTVASQQQRLRAELQNVERAIAHLAKAIGDSGPLESLVLELKAREVRRGELRATMAAAVRTDGARVSRSQIEQTIRQRLDTWRALLTSHVQDDRQLMREVLARPLTFTPEGKTYWFEGEAGDRTIARRDSRLTRFKLASLMPASWNQIAAWLDQIDRLRRAA